MSDNHDLLNDKDVCSFEEHEAENVCSNKDAVACRDGCSSISEICIEVFHTGFHQSEGHGAVRGEGPADVCEHPRLRPENARHEGQLPVRRADEGRVRTGNAGRQVR